MAASREEVYERVKEVLTEQLGIEEADITEEASFQEDLDADSLDLVELIMELEDQFGIKISDEDAQKITDRRPSRRLRHFAPVARRLRPRAADRRAPAGAGGARLHPRVVGERAWRVVRAARVPRRQRARARRRARALRAPSRLHRGAAREGALARRLSCDLRGRGSRARPRASVSSRTRLPPRRRRSSSGSRGTATCSRR